LLVCRSPCVLPDVGLVRGWSRSCLRLSGGCGCGSFRVVPTREVGPCSGARARNQCTTQHTTRRSHLCLASLLRCPMADCRASAPASAAAARTGAQGSTGDRGGAAQETRRAEGSGSRGNGRDSTHTKWTSMGRGIGPRMQCPLSLAPRPSRVSGLHGRSASPEVGRGHCASCSDAQ
jgi:hypothetical protein